MKKLQIGTLINILTVIVGGSIGLYFQNVFPPNIQAIVFQAIGLATLLIGINMLQLGKINIENLLPALVFGTLFTFLKEWLYKRKDLG